MTIVYRPLGNEITLNVASGSAITSSNNIGTGCLVRVINAGGVNPLIFQYANGVQYANITLANSESVVVWKNNTDLLLGNSMLAVLCAFKGL